MLFTRKKLKILTKKYLCHTIVMTTVILLLAPSTFCLYANVFHIVINSFSRIFFLKGLQKSSLNETISDCNTKKCRLKVLFDGAKVIESAS